MDTDDGILLAGEAATKAAAKAKAVRTRTLKEARRGRVQARKGKAVRKAAKKATNAAKRAKREAVRTMVSGLASLLLKALNEGVEEARATLADERAQVEALLCREERAREGARLERLERLLRAAKAAAKAAKKAAHAAAKALAAAKAAAKAATKAATKAAYAAAKAAARPCAIRHEEARPVVCLHAPLVAVAVAVPTTVEGETYTPARVLGTLNAAVVAKIVAEETRRKEERLDRARFMQVVYGGVEGVTIGTINMARAFKDAQRVEAVA